MLVVLPHTRFIKEKSTGVSTPLLINVAKDILLNYKRMADQLLSKDHFYLNCSRWNDSDVDQPATIHVSDTSDILTRSDGWMCHVTRFSVDSMKSLVFVEKDETASWEITIVSDVGTPTDTFTFILDRDYATPQDLIDEMNMTGRFRKTHLNLQAHPVAWEGDYYEMYRFELDPAGRIRLRTQPKTRALKPDWYVTYQGTASMNKLLGFDKVSPYLRWAPTAAHRFCRAIDLLAENMSLVATPLNIFDGDYWKAINKVLRSLLNGVEMYHKNIAGTAEVAPDLAGVSPHGIHNHHLFPRWYGSTPTLQNHTGEGIFPVHGIPVICEWLDVPHANNAFDHGPKVSINQLIWSTSYEANHAGTVGEGQLRFYDLYAGGGNGTAFSEPVRVTGYVPGPYNLWYNYRYAYPWQSLPGYWWGGTVARGANPAAGGNAATVPAGSVSIEHLDPADLSKFTLGLPLPEKVKVGHDMWVLTPASTSIFAVHCIETISEDRRTVEVDWPLGTRWRADPVNGVNGNVARAEVLFTDRRVPFQSRSATFLGIGLNNTHYDAETNTSLFVTLETTNASVGDTIYFVIGPDDAPEILHPGSLIVSNLQVGPLQLVTVQGRLPEIVVGYVGLPATAHTRVFVHKAIDAVRWEQDALRMKMAPATFQYEGRQNADRAIAFQKHLVMSTPVTETNVNGFVNGARQIAKYDATMLNRQINRFAKAFYDISIFDELQTYADTNETEKLTSTEIASIPTRSEIVRVGDGHTRVDFGAAEIRQVDNAQFTIIAPYGQGTHPQAIVRRFPNSLYALETYSQDGPDANENARVGAINAWVKAHPSELAVLEVMPASNPHLRFQQQVPQPLGRDNQGELTEFQDPEDTRLSPFCVGVRTRPQTGNDNFIIYAPPKQTPLQGLASWGLGWDATNNSIDNSILQPVDTTHLAAQLATANAALVGVDYSELTRSYEICKKEIYSVEITPTRPTRIFGYDGDYIASTLSSQIDLMFPFSKILLTSNDLLQVPERSQDPASRQPILTSYTLSTIIPTGVSADAEPTGSTSSPFGTVYFSEMGNRRYHHLIKGPGGLRQFRINAQLTYKNPNKMAKDIMLPSGAMFSCQLLFTRKMEQ